MTLMFFSDPWLFLQSLHPTKPHMALFASVWAFKKDPYWYGRTRWLMFYTSMHSSTWPPHPCICFLWACSLQPEPVLTGISHPVWRLKVFYLRHGNSRCCAKSMVFTFNHVSLFMLVCVEKHINLEGSLVGRESMHDMSLNTHLPKRGNAGGEGTETLVSFRATLCFFALFMSVCNY